MRGHRRASAEERGRGVPRKDPSRLINAAMRAQNRFAEGRGYGIAIRVDYKFLRSLDLGTQSELALHAKDFGR